MKKTFNLFLFIFAAILQLSQVTSATKRLPENEASSYTEVRESEAKRRKTASIEPLEDLTCSKALKSTPETETDSASGTETETDTEVEQDNPYEIEQEEIDIDTWIAGNLRAHEFSYIVKKFVGLMTQTFETSPWFHGVNGKSEIGYINSKIDVCDSLEFSFPILPYIAKWILPPNVHVEIIGDIHARKQTVSELLHMLVNKNLMDRCMNISPNVKLVFLGDLVDRGGDSLDVFATAMYLAIKNPGQVLILRGNHEDYELNEDYGIYADFEHIEPKNRIQAFNQLKLAYEVLPLELIVGFEGTTNLILLAHGGPDIRLDYTNFLNFQTKYHNFSLWKLRQTDLIGTKKIKEFIFFDVYNVIDEDLCALFASYIANKDLMFGSCWNDIGYDECDIAKSSRGEDAITIGPGLLEVFFTKFSGNNNRIIGVIHGHDHVTAKQLYEEENPSISNPIETVSPSTIVFKEPKARLVNADETIQIDTFSIMSTIAGVIKGGHSQMSIRYPTTMLDLSLSASGNFQVQTFYAN